MGKNLSNKSHGQFQENNNFFYLPPNENKKFLPKKLIGDPPMKQWNSIIKNGGKLLYKWST